MPGKDTTPSKPAKKPAGTGAPPAGGGQSARPLNPNNPGKKKK
jgi:hypothetical protein